MNGDPIRLRVVKPRGPEVNPKIVARLRSILADAEAGKVSAIAAIVIDEASNGNPVFEGDAPCVAILGYLHALTNIVDGWARDIVLDDGTRYWQPQQSEAPKKP